MKTDLIHSLTDTFEAHAQQTENGVEYWLARDLQHLLGYAAWRNFEGVIKRAIGIIKHRCLYGNIEKTNVKVQIGSGALREIVDYKLDRSAAEILWNLCSSYKLNNHFQIRNETVLLQLVEKYCALTGVRFIYQFRVEEYLFDCMLGNKLLIEFDEPHHENCSRQIKKDRKKDSAAKRLGFEIFRITLDMDIIDVIIFLQKNKIHNYSHNQNHDLGIL